MELVRSWKLRSVSQSVADRCTALIRISRWGAGHSSGAVLLTWVGLGGNIAELRNKKMNQLPHNRDRTGPFLAGQSGNPGGRPVGFREQIKESTADGSELVWVLTVLRRC